MDNTYCIYRHKRLDTNQVFYVGIGSEKRSRCKWRRSSFWKNITSKTEYEVDILKRDLSLEDACELEKILIQYYGRRDLNLGSLVNMTDGGEGLLGKICSEDTKLKMRKSSLGKKKSVEHAQNISLNSYMRTAVFCTISNKIWTSIRDCSKETGINEKTLAQSLRGDRKNYTTIKYLKDAV